MMIYICVRVVDDDSNSEDEYMFNKGKFIVIDGY